MIKNETVGAIERINVQLDDDRELSRRYLSESPYGGLVIDVDGYLEEEDLVELDVGFSHSHERHLIKAVVLWRRHKATGLTVGVGFLPSEAEKRERLFDINRKEQSQDFDYASTRTSNRYSTVLKVTYKSAEDFVLQFVRNLSSGGMFVSSSTPPSVDTTIVFELFPPGESNPIELPGRVVWSEPGTGFGVSFVALDEQSKGRLEKLVKRVSMGSNSDAREPVFEQVAR